MRRSRAAKLPPGDTVAGRQGAAELAIEGVARDVGDPARPGLQKEPDGPRESAASIDLRTVANTGIVGIPLPDVMILVTARALARIGLTRAAV